MVAQMGWGRHVADRWLRRLCAAGRWSPDSARPVFIRTTVADDTRPRRDSSTQSSRRGPSQAYCWRSREQ